MNHPAAEIVAIALRKISKLATGKKHLGQVLERCKELLDNIQDIVPAAASEAAAAAVAAASAAAAAAEGPGPAPHVLSAHPSLQEAIKEDEAAGSDRKAPAQAVEQRHPEAAAVKAHFEPEDIAEATADFTQPPATDASAAPASSDPLPESSTSSAAATPLTFNKDGVLSSGVAAAEAVSAAATAELMPDIMPRTEAALSDAVASRILAVLRVAIEAGLEHHLVTVIEVSLDCIQKLIAFKFLQGSAYAIDLDKQGGVDAGGEASLHDPAMSTPQAAAVELMCRCDEIPDEGVELQILKGILTATTSGTFTIHGQALLLVVRTCYNIYLMSRSDVNQTTAKASLTQMLNVVFQRMEADCVMVEVKPIMVSDVLGLPPRGSGGQDAASATSLTVQSFLNNVVMVATHGQSPEALRSSVAASLRMAHAQDDSEDSEHPGASKGQAQGAGGSKTPVSGAAHRTPSSTSLAGSGGGAVADGAVNAALEAACQTTADAARSSLLQKDAFLVFRALCKLSIRTSDTVTVQDQTAIRGKVLALELLKILLENSGPTFRVVDKFMSAIRQYLCLSLLKNSASTTSQVAQLTSSIFLTLMHKFRSSLKAEVGVFLPMMLLKPFEPAQPAPGATPGAAAPPVPSPAAAATAVAALLPARAQALRVIQEVARDGQLLVDLFVNYDCDLESSNLFERLVTALVKVAQQQPVSPPPPPLMVDTSGTAFHQEQVLRVEALQALVSLVESMLTWYRVTAGVAVEEAVAAAAGALDESSAPVLADTSPLGRGSVMPSASGADQAAALAAAEESSSPSAGPAAQGGGAGGEELNAKRAYKQKFQDCIALFNKKPRKGLEMLQAEGMLGRSPEDVANFLARTQGLNKTLIGDFLGEREEFSLKVMHCYVDAMDFTDMEFDDSIRAFLSGFRLPGEAQKIDRLMEKFAERYLKCNSTSFKSADVAYVLAYSVIMLNTDAHNPQVKVKMSREGFIKNNRGINDGQDLPEEFMSALYDRIVHNEIKLKDDALMGPNQGKDPNQAYTIFSTLLSMMGAVKQQVSTEPSEESIKGTLDYLHDKAKSSTAVTVTEPDAVRPMMEVIWAPLLGALSVLFDEYVDPRLIRMTLTGFAAGCSLTALMGMHNLRDIFINSLCNFTHLHSPSTMKFKNAMAFKSLLQVAELVGDKLQERWVDVLRCISRWELLQQISSGMPTDAVLFSAPQGEKGVKAVLEKARNMIRDPNLESRGVLGMDTLAMTETSIKKVHVGGSGLNTAGRKDAASAAISSEVINSCDSHELNAVFLRSSKLSSEAIVIFVRALASISQDELRDSRAPRVFSLTKIVEIAHYNMTRIRLVWSRIWAVLSDYFITVGCHPNLSVAMYAVDSLRQLAIKFLQRDELANYTFQNDFLRPFVAVMRQSQAVEIRELIIRCLSQMVLARVNNVKSGWKSMFMVFTTAAGDKDPMIVRLAFDTIEKIVREHFSHITETETTTFTDCVNCLIAFTNNPHSSDVALNSIAFLRFCALKLAEGAIGDVNELPEGVTPTDVMQHPLRVVAIQSTVTSSSFQVSNTSAPGTPLGSEHRSAKVDELEPSSSSTPASTSTSTTPPPGAARSSSSLLPSSSGLELDTGGSGAGGQALLMSSSGRQGPGAGGASSRSLKFVDRDEHVYFWFPLLAGLSELTFDPRPEIRTSALEVLFNTLKCHGGAFADSFWKRIFDSVLLPIFDHVRAEVTDTTTFTSDKRRQQEDAWLYETCTKCLQHLIDVSVMFYEETRCLLPRLTELLKRFMDRSHQSLAAVGVAAFVRLCSKAAHVMDDLAWEEVTEFLVSVAKDNAPNAQELVSPPSARGLNTSPSIPLGLESALSGSSVSEIQPVEALAPGGGSGGGGWAAAATAAVGPVAVAAAPPAARAFSLREGVGARRLAKFRSHAAMQLLLVQGCSETYAGLNKVMPPVATTRLLQALDTIAAHARSVDLDLDLRRRLVFQQVEDRVPEERTVLDPPLLRLETEAAHAYLSVLTHVVLLRPALRPPQLLECSGAAARLVALCGDVLQRYVLGVTGQAAAIRQAEAAEAAAAAAAGVRGAAPASKAGGGFASVLLGGARRAAPAPAGATGAAATPRQPDGRTVVVARSSAGLPVLMASAAAEYSSFAPLVASVLKALSGAVEEDAFRAALPTLFPLLALVIRADYVPSEVHRALSDLMLTRVGPLIGAPPPAWAVSGRS